MPEFLLQASTLWTREIARFVRQRSRLVGAILQPLVFWALLGAGLGASFRPAGMPSSVGYAQYFYPGVIVLVLLFTAIFATIATVEDRREGFLQGVLVAPVSRTTIVLGQAMGATTLALMQGLVFLILAPLAGIHLSIGAILLTAAMMTIIAFALTSIGLTIAWRIESTQGFHAIMNLILIPIWMLSGAFFPITGAPGWLRWTMELNPLTYAMAALRDSLYLAEPGSAGASILPLGLSALIAIVFAAAMFTLASRTASRVRTV
ncbi:MAG TPA: ABC transporter permease [Candidatus Binataceae bacterium]|nr:ABC transporter permease [Candidatus Binataceae bacterium]